MRNFKNFVHRQTLARLNYRKRFNAIGVTFSEYCDFIYRDIKIDGKLYWAELFGTQIKRLNSYSFVHSIEEIFIDQLYKFESNASNPYIIDCGANIGLSTIYFKRLYPKAKIIAFEPDEIIYKACEYNLKAFKYNDVELINAAVWKTDGYLSFLPDNSLGGKVIEGLGGNHEVRSVKSVDLKRFLSSQVDFLKIDIEGAEIDVLMDCKDNLLSVRNLFVEYHSDSKNPQKLQDLLQVLTNAGFRYYIKHAWDYMAQPFVEFKRSVDLDYDLQLNIFAYRV